MLYARKYSIEPKVSSASQYSQKKTGKTKTNKYTAKKKSETAFWAIRNIMKRESAAWASQDFTQLFHWRLGECDPFLPTTRREADF